MASRIAIAERTRAAIIFYINSYLGAIREATGSRSSNPGLNETEHSGTLFSRFSVFAKRTRATGKCPVFKCLGTAAPRLVWALWNSDWPSRASGSHDRVHAVRRARSKQELPPSLKCARVAAR